MSARPKLREVNMAQTHARQETRAKGRLQRGTGRRTASLIRRHRFATAPAPTPRSKAQLKIGERAGRILSFDTMRRYFEAHQQAMDIYLWHNPRTVFFHEVHGGPFGARLGAGMTAAQKDMITRPDAVVMRAGGRVIVLMVMIMGMTMVVVVGMIVQGVPMGVIVRHSASLAPSGHKSAP